MITFSWHDVIIIAFTLLLNNWIQRVRKIETEKPETIAELVVHIDAVADKLETRIDAVATDATAEIATVDHKVNELAESTINAISSLKNIE